MDQITVFLGANSYHGFVSLYEEYLAAVSPARLFILKGGAGCGKSTYMRRIAERAEAQGKEVIYVLCSGDPDSLDGIVLPELGAAFFDGTAPHVLEPPLVGFRGFYIDLSRFYRAPVPALEPRDAAYREHYRKAYLYLSAPGSVEAAEKLTEKTAEAIRARAVSLAERSLRRRRGDPAGRCTRCFTDAFTCQGSVSLSETRRALAPRLIALEGGSVRGDLFLRAFRQIAEERGHETVLCPDPLRPERIAHLLLPGLGFGVTTGEGDRRIHLERLGDAPGEGGKAEHKEAEGMRLSLLHKAKKELSLAKHDHDRLEAAVHPYVDFPAVEAAAQETADRILNA